MAYRPRFLASIHDIDAPVWNALTGIDYPFLRHEFLAALEDSGCVTAATGWQPHHLVLYRDTRAIAVMPLYLKHHSYGEYVFDWAWADAYQRHGLNYYPKLLSAIPFTPASGPRIGYAQASELAALIPAILKAMLAEAERLGVSSWHLLFQDDALEAHLHATPLLHRSGCQYHWLNEGYASFEGYLATFTSKQRKNLKRERRKVAEQGVELRIHRGAEVTPERMATFYPFYRATYAARGQRGYLNRAFFQQLALTMPEQLVLIMAYQQDRAIAGALCFQGADTLYGRYWGTSHPIECLHFETCYYQGIEYCIAHGLRRFDPGAQGEHKIQRGFQPRPTHSRHWIAHPAFHDAIARFLHEEAVELQHYLREARTLLPFKRGD